MQMRKLDSPEGIQALIQAVGPARSARWSQAELASAYLESWEHPWLAAWGAKQGFVDPDQTELSMEDRTGHWDHAPYATNSASGKALETPFGTRDGQVYLVIYDPWVKGVCIVGQIESGISRLLRARGALWSPAFRQAGETIRKGFAAMGDGDLGPDAQGKAVQRAQEAFQDLQGGLGESMVGWSAWTSQERNEVVRLLGRLEALQGALKLEASV